MAASAPPKAAAPAWRGKKALAIGACLVMLGTANASLAHLTSLREQELANAAALIASEERGIIDSFSDQLPASMATLAGQLKRVTSADGTRFVALDGKALYQGSDANWQFPLRKFDLGSNKQAILMASSGGHGFHCETRFFFLVADRKGVQPTPLFGTCAPRITFRHVGDSITFLFPRIGGLSSVEFKAGALTEDGVQIAMNDTNHPFK